MARDASMTMERFPAAGYVAPFAVFLAFLAVNSYFPVPQWARFAIEAGLILTISRVPLSQGPTRPSLSAALGVAVFVIWIAPDQVIAGYREHLLFHNGMVGHAAASTTDALKRNIPFLTFRVLMSVTAIPILEELFWRGFLLRWLIRKDFLAVPLGTWSAEAFWVVAVLFALEHGPYWDVGLVAGVIYNWWMLRTGSLWDCIIAHAVTNACLAVFAIEAGQWQYWL